MPATGAAGRTTGRHRGSAAALAGFALAAAALALLFYREELLGGRIAVFRDQYTILLPLDWTVRLLSRADLLPTWNPFEVLGKPLLADPLAAVLYPPAAASRLLPFPLGFSVSTAFHHVVAALGTFVLLRGRGVPDVACALGGVLFGFGGALVSADNMRNVLQSAAWMPWTLAAFDAWCGGSGAAALACAAVGVALTLLGGLPEVFAFEQLLFAAVALESAASGRGGGQRAVAGALAADLLGCGLAAVLLVPATLLVLRSSRAGGLDAAAASELSLSPAGLLAFLVPRHYVGPDGAFHETAGLFEPGRARAPWALTLYLGPVLAVVAALVGDRGAKAWGAVAVAFLLVALGDHVPGQAWLVAHAPPLRWVRHPEKALLGLQLALAVLAGTALGAALREPSRFRRIAVAASTGAVACAADWFALRGEGAFATGLLRADLATALLLFLAIAAIASLGRARPVPAGIALALLASADLLRVNAGLLPTVEAGELRAAPAALAAVTAGEPPQRIYSDALGPRPARSFPEGFLLERELLLWEVSSFWGIANLNAPSSLNLSDDERLMRVVEAAPRARVAPILAALSTAVVTSTKDLAGFADLERVPTAASGGPVSAWRVAGVSPRAFVARTVVPVSGRDEAIAHLASFDRPAETVAVEGPPPAGLPPEVRGTVAIESYAPDEVVLASDLATPALVVLNDAWDPAWRASVDGVDAPVLRVNGFTRGVVVPAGRPRIVFRHRPAGVLAGGAITLLSALVAAALLLRPRAGSARGREGTARKEAWSRAGVTPARNGPRFGLRP